MPQKNNIEITAKPTTSPNLPFVSSNVYTWVSRSTFDLQHFTISYVSTNQDSMHCLSTENLNPTTLHDIPKLYMDGYMDDAYRIIFLCKQKILNFPTKKKVILFHLRVSMFI